MARKTTNNTTPNEAKSFGKKFTLPGWEIKNIRWSADNKYCSFSLIFEEIGLKLYNLTLRYTAAGVPFISFPSRKGSDGKYYGYYYVNLSDDMVGEIVDILEDA